MQNKILILSLLALLSFLTSCTQNKIFLENTSKDLNKNHTEGVNLIVENYQKKLGYQYLFFFFPFGVNHLENTNLDLAKFLEIELLSKGLHLDSESEKVIYVKVDKLNVNVQDYIFTRKLKCSAELSLAFYNDKNLLKNSASENTYSSYEQFAFIPKMTFCLQEALLGAFSDGIKDVSFKH